MIKRTKRLTMLDIADMAGVDKAVVSKVVNNAKTIPASREKVERVREIIRKYHYTPLSSAQSLATRCTRQIAFLLSDASEALLANPVFSNMRLPSGSGAIRPIWSYGRSHTAEASTRVFASARNGLKSE